MRRRVLPGRSVQQPDPTCGEKHWQQRSAAAAVPDSGRQRGMAEGRAAGEEPAAAGPTAEAAGEEGAPAPGDGGGEGAAEGRVARDEGGAGAGAAALALRVEFRGLPRASLERLNAALADWARFHRGLAAADGGSAAAPGLLSGELKFVPPTAGAEEAILVSPLLVSRWCGLGPTLPSRKRWKAGFWVSWPVGLVAWLG